MEVEEEAEAEKEDLKAREAQKKVSYSYLLFVCIYISLFLVAWKRAFPPPPGAVQPLPILENYDLKGAHH